MLQLSFSSAVPRSALACFAFGLFVATSAACATVSEPGATENALTPATAPTIGDPNPTASPAGAQCAGGNDCKSGVCTTAVCQASAPNDGVKNSDESDTDCGGDAGPKCENGKRCATDANCKSGICNAGSFTCSDTREVQSSSSSSSSSSSGDDPPPKAPTFDDKTKNGTETDVDCGGPADGPRCTTGKICKEHADCESDGCTFEKKCALRPSCTQLEGGYTCGANESMTKQNDCCESAKVGQFEIDKYEVTAGRMRGFLTHLDGKVRDWAAKLPANRWDQGLTDQLPNSIEGEPGDPDNANTQLGPFFAKRSCDTGDHTGHTFWTPANYGDTKQFSKEVLDTKALNCVPWTLIAALCAFDGGHLMTEAELRAAYTNAGSTSYPWGARDGYTSTGQNDFAVQEFSYETPGQPSGFNGYLDIAGNIAPPGRRSKGYNKTGHADLVGNLIEWVGDSHSQFVWKGSFERHAREADVNIVPPTNNDPFVTRNPKNGRTWHWDTDVGVQDGTPNGYYAIGGRCAY